MVDPEWALTRLQLEYEQCVASGRREREEEAEEQPLSHHHHAQELGYAQLGSLSDEDEGDLCGEDACGEDEVAAVREDALGLDRGAAISRCSEDELALRETVTSASMGEGGEERWSCLPPTTPYQPCTTAWPPTTTASLLAEENGSAAEANPRRSGNGLSSAVADSSSEDESWARFDEVSFEEERKDASMPSTANSAVQAHSSSAEHPAQVVAELPPEHVQQIKHVMASLSVAPPPPPWASLIPEEKWIKHLLGNAERQPDVEGTTVALDASLQCCRTGLARASTSTDASGST